MPRPTCVYLLLLLGLLTACARRNRINDLDQQLLEAARKGETGLIDRLLKKGANIEAKDKAGSTPLALAVDHGHPQAAELLVQAGGSMAGAGIAGDDALVESARNSLVYRTEFLLRRNPDPKTKNEALFAVAEDAPAVVAVVVDPKTQPPPQAEGPAIAESSSDTAELLLANGANLEARDVEGSTPLIRAAEFGNTE